MVPEFLCLGHVCHDWTEKGFVLGGTASYCSLIAAHLDVKTALVTSFGQDFLFRHRFSDAGIEVRCKTAAETTVFKNIYYEGGRTQYLIQRAETLNVEDIPEEWRKVPIVKFCLIADEIDPGIPGIFKDSLRGATIQGWLRGWNASGKIFPKPMDWDILKDVDVICMSVDDIRGFEEFVPQIASLVEILIVTDGSNGAKVHFSNSIRHFPSYPVIEIDPTGAGDVFAVGFLLEYAKTRDIEQSVTFAHCAASLIVEGAGIANVTEIEKLHNRIEDYRQMFLR